MATFTIDYVDNWPDRLLTRFYEQFKGKRNLTALAHDVCGPQFQDLEDSAQSLLMLPSIDDGKGLQLDMIGRLVGQTRRGVDDTTYRLYLHARVQTNRSSGLPDPVYSVLGTLLPEASFAISQQTPGTLFVIVDQIITNDEAILISGFVADAVIDGVRAYLLWQEQADDETFTLDGGPGLDVGKLANVVIGIPNL